VNNSGVLYRADLGTSSNYSNEVPCVDYFSLRIWCFEDRSGEGFLANGKQTRVSRS